MVLEAIVSTSRKFFALPDAYRALYIAHPKSSKTQAIYFLVNLFLSYKILFIVIVMGNGLYKWSIPTEVRHEAFNRRVSRWFVPYCIKDYKSDFEDAKTA